MKNFFVRLALCAGIFSPLFSSANRIWNEVEPNSAPEQLQLIRPSKFKVYTLDETTLHTQLWNLANTPENGEIMSLPMPDGTMKDFIVWETSMMPSQLAAQFEEIKTFTATAVEDPTVSAKLDFTLYGFHAMIYDGENTSFIDPFDNYRDGFYLVHYKKDLERPTGGYMKCELHNDNDDLHAGEPAKLKQPNAPTAVAKTINGYNLRTYRLALSCSNQYARAATGLPTPTKPQVLSKMTTTMNRVNGVYEREFSITMQFVTNQNALIFITASGDPFNSINSSAGALLSANQTQCNSLIGTANYDIGHVFTTGSGGLASLGCVCRSFNKAQGTTGSPSPTGDAFDIDYVAHEIGHQFGSNHTFNNGLNGSCAGGNAESTLAYEPGSGSTIMAYAGICSPDNVQSRSDPYFHTASIEKILAYVNTTATCATSTPTGNKLVKYNAFTPTTYSIPYLTPFELTAPVATDSVGDSVVLYGWEQYDLGGIDFGKSFANTAVAGPIFRSFNPSKSNVRVFPKMSLVLLGSLNSLHEKAPTVARSMKFKCIFRNIRNNKGSVTIPDETININAVTTGTGAGFKVTSQSTAGIFYTGGTTQTITWDRANSNNAPVSAANVDIYMSVNGGTDWAYLVGTFPNTGTASVTIPNPAANTTAARFKVKGTGNVFFNVNGRNFSVDRNPTLPTSTTLGVASTPSNANDTKVYPVPAMDMLYIASPTIQQAAIYNVTGQAIWQGDVTNNTTINVSTWAKGMYYIKIGQTEVKKIIIQ